MSKKIMGLIRYAMCGQYVFHGSPTRIDGKLLPNHTQRITGRRVMYDETSLHATPLLYVSLTYLARHPTLNQNCSSSVSLFKAENTMGISCADRKETLQATFDILFSRGGYVYVLPAERFSSRKGLGMLEVVSFKGEKPVDRVRLSKKEITTLFQMLGTHIVRD